MRTAAVMKSTLLRRVCALAFVDLALAAGVPAVFAAETAAVVVDVSPADLQAFQNDADNGAMIPALQAQIREASPAKRAQLEKALLGVAADTEATVAGRQAACTVLAGFASNAAIRPLGGLLNDPRLSRSARFILEPMPGSAVDCAFLSALAKSSNDTRAGLINALGVRRVARAVRPLTELANGDDKAAAGAAVHALGAIGNEAALEILMALDPAGPAGRAREDAILLACGSLMTAERVSKSALAALEQLRQGEQPAGVRAAAWRLSIKAEPKRALEHIMALLASDVGELRSIGAEALDLVDAGEAHESLAAAAKSWPPESRARLIENLSAERSSAVLELARESITAEDEYLKATSIAALGRIGDASDLDALFDLAAGGGATSEDALAAIAFLPDPAVNMRLVEAFKESDPALRHLIPGILAARSHREAVPVLLEAGPAAGRAVASEIYKAIGILGGVDVVPVLLEQWDEAPPARSAIGRAAVAIGRQSEEGEVVRLLAPRIESADEETRNSAVRMVGAIGDAPALELLKPLITADPPDDAALRAVFAWQDADAIPVLQAVIARDNLEDLSRQSAWRSLLRISGETFREEREESLRGFQTCMMSAFKKEDRAQVVEALAEFNDDAVVSMLRGWLLIPGASAAADEALQALDDRRRNSGRAR
ncbi:MAG: HEAT repeat domain-containing protein [Opitutaceae bacterium]